jgi:hypothetical protein
MYSTVLYIHMFGRRREYIETLEGKLACRLHRNNLHEYHNSCERTLPVGPRLPRTGSFDAILRRRHLDVPSKECQYSQAGSVY